MESCGLCHKYRVIFLLVASPRRGLASRPGGSGWSDPPPCSSLLRLVAASPPAREARVGVGKYLQTTSKRSQNVLGMFGNDLFFDPESVILMSKMRYFEALRAFLAISGFWCQGV